MADKPIPLILDGKFFEIVTTENNTVKAKCTGCPEGKKSVFSGSFAATSNFLKHLKRAHPKLHDEYERYSRDAEVQAKRKKQSTLPFQVEKVVSSPQIRTERLYVQYIVNAMLPLSTVEDSSFRTLVQGLNPSASVMCTKTLKSRLEYEMGCMRTSIRKQLSSIEFVSCTADVWSTKTRSFLGVTAHWLNSDLTRKSCVLGVKRFAGSHTHIRIAEHLYEMFSVYGIESKVITVVTDNGSNFVKAFQEYGLDVESIEDDEELVDDVELEEERIQLPGHIRCASHTLSLVATKDVEKDWKVNDPLLANKCKKIMRSAFGKCTAFWNKLSKSVKTSESVKGKIGKQFTRPVVTRWNSTFDAVTDLLKHRDSLKEVFEEAGIAQLTDRDLEFLDEYVKAMKPVSIALDTLQKENEFYFGYLAPVIVNLRNELSTLSMGTGCGSVLAKNMLGGSNLLSFSMDNVNQREVLAACTLPLFKLRWIPSEHRQRVRAVFISELACVLSEQNVKTPVEATGSELSKWDKMFGPHPSTETAVTDQEEISTKAEIMALQFFSEAMQNLIVLDKYPPIKHLFTKYNTSLPSSAPAERLFSYCGMILRPRRSSLSDETFETLTLLKLNTTIHPL